MTVALDPVFGIALRGAIAAVFGFAAIHKLTDLTKFSGTLRTYVRSTRLDGVTTVSVLSVVVILAEALVALAALAPVPAAWAGAGAVCLFLAYGAAIAANIARGNVLLDCGCSWGAARQPATVALVIRNVGLAALAAFLLLPAGARSLGGFELVSSAAGAAMILCIYVVSNQLIANGERLKEQVK